MSKKKLLIGIMIFTLGLMISISAIRWVTFNTLFNQHWHLTIKHKLHYYDRVSNEINAHLKEKLLPYEVPSHLADQVVSPEKVKLYLTLPINQMMDSKKSVTELKPNELYERLTSDILADISSDVSGFLTRLVNRSKTYEQDRLIEIEQVVYKEITNHLMIQPEQYGNIQYLVELIFIASSHQMKGFMSVMFVVLSLSLWFMSSKRFKFVWYCAIAFFTSGILLQLFVLVEDRRSFWVMDNKQEMTEQLISMGHEFMMSEFGYVTKIIFIVGLVLFIASLVMKDFKLLKEVLHGLS